MSPIVTDIEGTTSSISFVHDVLFPYARAHLPTYIQTHQDDDDVAQALKHAQTTMRTENRADCGGDIQSIIAELDRWMAEDRKHTALKALQGMVWKAGYRDGAFRGHVYADAVSALRRWRELGHSLAVFSSGSIAAQKLLFRHTSYGDLASLFDHFFDTTTGPKKEPRSYELIANALRTPPHSVLYLSDVEAELDAARAAGMRTTQVVRSGTVPSTRHPTVATFAELSDPQ